MKIKKVISKTQYHIFPIILIWIAGLIFMRYNTSLRIVGDEFGYWAAGSWIIGNDWSEIASNNSYYGYGYGLILSLIISLPINPVMQYRIAILLNVLMLTGVYAVIYCMIIRLEFWGKGYMSALVAVVITLYTGNIFYTQFSMTEPILLLSYWLVLILLYSICEKRNYYKTFLFVLLLAYMFSIHQRMIGVFVVGLFVLLCIYVKDRNWKHILFSLALAAFFLILVIAIKKVYQDTYLSNSSNNILAANDFGGQISKIMSLFSFDGIKLLFTGMIGKFFYIASSSYLLCLVGGCEIVRTIIKSIKEKSFKHKEYIYVFCVLSVFMAIGISTVFLLDYRDRFDLLIYGRYIEYAVSPLILIGLFKLVNTKKIDSSFHFGIVIAYVLLLAVVTYVIPMEATVDVSHMHCTGINDMLKLSTNNIYAVGVKTIFVYILMVLILRLLASKRINLAIISVSVILSVNWFISYIYTYHQNILSWSIAGCSSKEAQADFIKELGIENNLYYYVPDDNLAADFLQFLLGEATIHCIYSEDDIENLPENSYILTDYISSLDENMLKKNYTQISNAPYRIWKPKEEYEKVIEYENVQMNNFEIGMQIFLKEYPKDTKPVQLLSKWNYWQNEMSYLVQIDEEYFAVIFSGTGSDTEGIWIDISMLELGTWQDVVITFENGLVSVFVDNELKGSREVSFESVYNSEHVATVGNDLKDIVREIYISPIKEVNLNEEYPSFVGDNVIVMSATKDLKDNGDGVRLSDGNYMEIREKEAVSYDDFEIGMQVFFEEFPTQEKLTYLLTKYRYWQSEMSYVVGLDKEYLAVIFSGTGTDSDGIWLKKSILKLGEWNDLKITFNKGILRVSVNGKVEKEKQLAFDCVYFSEISTTVGGNFNGTIKLLYIK